MDGFCRRMFSEKTTHYLSSNIVFISAIATLSVSPNSCELWDINNINLIKVKYHRWIILYFGIINFVNYILDLWITRFVDANIIFTL